MAEEEGVRTPPIYTNRTLLVNSYDRALSQNIKKIEEKQRFIHFTRTHIPIIHLVYLKRKNKNKKKEECNRNNSLWDPRTSTFNPRRYNS